MNKNAQIYHRGLPVGSEGEVTKAARDEGEDEGGKTRGMVGHLSWKGDD